MDSYEGEGVDWTHVTLETVQWPVTTSCEHSNNHSDSIKEKNFFHQLTTYQLLKRGLINYICPQTTVQWMEDYANPSLEF